MAYNTAQAIYQGLIARGVNPHVATGAVASLMGESGSRLNPNAFRANDAGSGNHSYGIGQWNRQRASGLFSTAKQMGVPWNDPRAQVSYLLKELDGPESGTLAALRKGSSVRDGVDSWTRYYERPKVVNTDQRLRGVNNAVAAINAGGDVTTPTTAVASAQPQMVQKLTPVVNPTSFGSAIVNRPAPSGLLAAPFSPPAATSPTPGNIVADAAPTDGSVKQPDTNPGLLARIGSMLGPAQAAAADNPPIPASFIAGGNPGGAPLAPPAMNGNIPALTSAPSLLSSPPPPQAPTPAPAPVQAPMPQFDAMGNITMPAAQPQPAAPPVSTGFTPAQLDAMDRQKAVDAYGAQLRGGQPLTAPGSPPPITDPTVGQRTGQPQPDLGPAPNMYDFARQAPFGVSVPQGLLSAIPQTPQAPAFTMEMVPDPNAPAPDATNASGSGSPAPTPPEASGSAADTSSSDLNDKTKMANLIGDLTKAALSFSQIGQRDNKYVPPVSPVASFNHPNVPLPSLFRTQLVRPSGPVRGILG